MSPVRGSFTPSGPILARKTAVGAFMPSPAPANLFHRPWRTSAEGWRGFFLKAFFALTPFFSMRGAVTAVS